MKPVFLTAAFILAFSQPLAARTVSATLDNGMKIVVREDRRAPVAVSQLWYSVGAQDEKTGKTGLSHALEHLMFKGTEKIPAGGFSRRIAALGGYDNAYTSREVTVYHQNIAAQHLPEVLAMEADRMANLNFSDAAFDNEMKVIREERRLRTEDSPAGKLWELTYQTAFSQPFNRAPVIGYMDDLFALKAGDLRDWYTQWYTPNNATLVVVGDVDAEELIAQARKHFGALPARTLPARQRGSEPAQNGASAETAAPGELPLLNLAYTAPALNTENAEETLPYALSMLAEILSGDDSARLPARLVRGTQNAVNAYAYYPFLGRGDSLFILAGAPRDGWSAQQLQAALQHELADIAQNGIDGRELARTRIRTAAAREYAKDSMQAQADLIGELENSGIGYAREDELRQRLLSVDAAAIQAAAQYLTAQKPAVIVVHPQKP